MLKKISEHLGVLGFFLLGAILSTYPLIQNFSTHYLGAPGSDSQVFAWNVWHFRWTILNQLNPLYSDLQYWPCGGVLLFHSYSLFNNFIGYFLQSHWNLPETLNIISLLSHVLSGWGTYLLVRRLGGSRWVSLWAGFFYSFHYQVANLVGREYDYMWIAPIPFFIWSYLKAQVKPSPLNCFLPAVMMTWAWLCSPYYFNFCVILAGILFITPYLDVQWEKRGESFLRGMMMSFGFLFFTVGSLWLAQEFFRKGQIEFHGTGGAKEILLYVAPYWAAFSGAILLIISRMPKPVIRLKPGLFGAANLYPFLGTMVCWAVLNAPLIGTVLALQKSGIGIDAGSKWRGGGISYDALNYLTPNLSHPLLTRFENSVQGLRGGGLSLLAVAFLIYFHFLGFSIRSLNRAKDWIVCAAISIVLSLGTFLVVGGFKTYIPMPFWLFRQLPLVGNMFGVERFLAIHYLMLAILAALALDKLILHQFKKTRRVWILLSAFALTAFESWHSPQPLSAYDRAPKIFSDLREAPEGAALYLPYGAIFRDPKKDMGISRLNDVYYQIFHRKPMINGAYGRTPSYTANAFNANPFLRELSETQKRGIPGKHLTRHDLIRQFLRTFSLRYILVEESLIPPSLADVMKKWPLTLKGRENGFAVYEIKNQ